jgi:uncharacterized membrane protein
VYGINNSGQVAGSAVNGSDARSFVGSPSGSTVIPLPAGWSFSGASAINNVGQVAGGAVNGGGFQAFIGTTSGITLIPLPAGWSSSYAAR